jgi:hypothetical protein
LIDINDNNYTDAATNVIYIADGAASKYRQNAGSHQWLTAPSGTAGDAISFTQAMTLTAAGNLGVGTSSPSGKLQVKQANTAYGLVVEASGNDAWVRFHHNDSLGIVETTYNTSAGYTPLTFKTGGTERARIDSSGNLLVGTTSLYGGEKLALVQSTNNRGFVIQQTNASNTSPPFLIDCSRNTTNETYNALAYYNSGASAYRFYVTDNGGGYFNGNVGIGTSSPTQQLTIEGAMNLRNGSRAGAFEIDSSGNLWVGTATTAGNIIFESGHTTAGLPSTGGERARIDSSGHLIVPAGISSTADTAAANALDDYEEGTFTVFARDEDNNAQTYYESPGQYNRGHYVKIGQYVYFTIQMYTSGSGSTVGTQAVKITGLPFTAATVGGNGNVGSCTFPYFSDSSGGVGVFVGSVTEGGTSIYIQKTDTNGVTSAATITNWSTPRLSAVGWYRAAA